MAFQNNGLMKRRADNFGSSGDTKRQPPQISAFVMAEIAVESQTNVFTSPSPEITDSISTKPIQRPSEIHSIDRYLQGWPKERSWSNTATWVTEMKYSIEADSTLLAGALPSFSGSSDWNEEARHHLTPMYAGVILAPIIALGIVAGLILICLRRRKRLIKARAAQMNAQEMTMQSRPSVQPYMAPSPTVSTHFSTSPTVPQPVILGPIPSGENGAYLTGIDTSDAVSVASDSRPSDPFADNNSIAEPPPPYRPRSVAPPSFVSASRQNSLRTSTPPPTTSQTQLIERSPFEDPVVDDDAVSEISEPTAGQNHDTMSAVSDLSYQHDPVVGRTNI